MAGGTQGHGDMQGTLGPLRGKGNNRYMAELGAQEPFLVTMKVGGHPQARLASVLRSSGHLGGLPSLTQDVQEGDDFAGPQNASDGCVDCMLPSLVQ